MPIPGFPFSFSALEVKAQLSAQAESMSAQAFQTQVYTWLLVIPGNECEEFYQPGEDFSIYFYSTIFQPSTTIFIWIYNLTYPSNYANMWGLYITSI